MLEYSDVVDSLASSQPYDESASDRSPKSEST